MDQTIFPSIRGEFPLDIPADRHSSDQLLYGTVEKLIYFDEDTGQCSLQIKTESDRETKIIHTVLPVVFPGQQIEYKYHSESQQIIWTQILVPKKARATKKFLRSEAFGDLGSHLAGLLSREFPDNLFEVLSQTPEQIKKIPGVGPQKFKKILTSWQNYQAYEKLQNFLFTEDLPLSWGKKLWKAHQEQSLNIFLSFPYACAQSLQFPFVEVDRFALKNSWAEDAPERIRCALYDLLFTHYNEGHCAYPEDKLLAELQKFLKIPDVKIEECLEIEVLSEKLVCEKIGSIDCIYLKEIWLLERKVAKKFLEFENKSPDWGWINISRALSWAQNILDIKLALLQKDAIETALNSSLTIITGGPGTGKTTLVRSLVTILKTQSTKFALCTPTGRAAQRLEEATEFPAQTIHRLLKYESLSGRFQYNAENKLDLDMVLVDEVSMVDLALMSHLIDALPAHCSLVLVGDRDQIPSVGAGNVLQSLIDSGRFSTVRLTDGYRQSEESQISVNAKRINLGQMPVINTEETSDFHFIPVQNSEQAKKAISDLVINTIPQKFGISDPRHLQVLVPLNKGPLGTLQLNEELKNHFTLDGLESIKEITGYSTNFKTGDKVMVTKNNYKKGVFNGDIGFIQDINTNLQILSVQFDDREVTYHFDELENLTLAYAISIHKSQGSEYRAVIVIICEEHLPLAQRHLIYTAVTRGKEQVFLVAVPTALQKAILSDDDNRRWQKLTELLTLGSSQQKVS